MGGLYDKKSQKAEAKINVGKEQIRMAREGSAGAIPQKLSNKDRLKLSKAGTKKLLEGTMEKNKVKRRSNKVTRRK